MSCNAVSLCEQPVLEHSSRGIEPVSINSRISEPVPNWNGGRNVEDLQTFIANDRSSFQGNGRSSILNEFQMGSCKVDIFLDIEHL